MLEQARNCNHNVKHHALKKLHFSKKWLDTDKAEQQNLKADTVETLEESHFHAEQSDMILDSLIESNSQLSAKWFKNSLIVTENTAKVQWELKKAVETEKDLDIAEKIKGEKLQKKNVSEEVDRWE